MDRVPELHDSLVGEDGLIPEILIRQQLKGDSFHFFFAQGN
jgi:hypothetical protein